MKYDPFVQFYGLNFAKGHPGGHHAPEYTAIEQGAYDVMIVYATDGLNIRAGHCMEDDLHFFPDYYGTILVRNDVFEQRFEQAPIWRKPCPCSTVKFTDQL